MELKSFEERLIVLEDDMDMLRKLPERVTGLSDRVTALSDRVTGLSDRVTGLSDQVAGLSDRVTTVESNILQFRADVRVEFSAVREEMRHEIQRTVDLLRSEIRAGDAETRRYMRVLHEEVLTRIANIHRR
jgi:predicted  nucleic acid-binding Zn-ribbon protein